MTRLRGARLDELELPLVTPFVTSFGSTRRRRFLVLSLRSHSGETGIAECVAAVEPLYSGETVETVRSLLVHRFLPALLREPVVDLRRWARVSAPVRGNPMAKALVEMALHDLVAREAGVSLAHHLGGRRQRVEVGVSVGIQKDVPSLLRVVGRYLDQGYCRIKLKVRPGWDAVPVRAVRRQFPDVRLWVDANQAYPSGAADRIADWAERAGVEQVEQPFDERAIRAHARLQRGRRFRVCLDESVVDRASLGDAIGARALQSLNVKPGRVGGHDPSVALSRLAAVSSIPSWVGGMLESGIGRAHLLALASRPEFTLPADISASSRYYAHDLTDPPFTLGPASTIAVPRGGGLGVSIDPRRYRHAVRRTSRYRR